MRLASTLAAAFGRLPGPVRAGLWMTAAAAAFGTMSGCINALAPEIHPLETAFFRSIIGTLLLAPWLLGTRRAVLKTNKHGLYFSRALASTVTQMGIFTGLTLMPMADAIALTFTAPLFGLLLAAPLLGERLHLRRVAATLAGFAGVLVIVRPGIVEMTPAAAIPLAAAVSLACVFIILKKLSRTEPTERIVFYMVVYMTPITLVPALFVWTTPEWRHVPLLLGVAISANLVQLGVTKAYAAADATAVMPYDFLRLPFTALVGYLAFAQVPDPYTWVGAAVIFGASVTVARREARASRVPARG
ncbi:MAG: DMT family transporter [Rhodospirillales bacterium]